MYQRYVSFAERHTAALLTAFLVLAGLALVPVTRLELHTSLTELLPDDHPAVQAFRRVGPRQIASSNLVLIVESPDRDKNRAFIEALRKPLTALVPQTFSEIQWKPETEVPAFAGRWRWLYAGTKDLRSAENLLDRLIARRTSPF